MIVSNKIKCLLINLLLLAGVYCSWGCSCCADCYKKCCGKGDNEKTVSEKMRITTRKNKKLKKIGDNIPDDNKGQLPTEKNNDIKDEIKDNNKKENLEEDTKENEKQKALYFKIQGRAIDSNKLGCFGKDWFNGYMNNTVLLYELTEQHNVKEKEVGTLVCTKGNKELRYNKSVDLPASLEDSDHKWAIFKVTTLNEDKKGESHIFYCSDVSSISNNGLFEEVDCWSIEILAANTQEVKTFCAMFYKTNSYLEQDIKQQNKSGFIGLEELDLSSAENLSYMFYMALFKQGTIDSLSKLRPRNDAEISRMFCVDTSKFVDKNVPNFRVLNGWVVGRNVYLICYLTVSKYEVFFQGNDNSQNNDKLPDWYENKIKLVRR